MICFWFTGIINQSSRTLKYRIEAMETTIHVVSKEKNNKYRYRRGTKVQELSKGVITSIQEIKSAAYSWNFTTYITLYQKAWCIDLRFPV
jgi:hypothetical protein